MHQLALSRLAFTDPEMTDLPTLSYTSTSEILTFSEAWKDYPFGRSLPVQDITGCIPPPAFMCFGESQSETA